jgi:hypothetical protein
VKLYNWLIAFAAGVGGFLFGYEIGIIKYVSKVTMYTLFIVEENAEKFWS